MYSDGQALSSMGICETGSECCAGLMLSPFFFFSRYILNGRGAVVR